MRAALRLQHRDLDGTDERRQFDYRLLLRRRAQIGFVGISFGVESQDIGHHRKRVEQGNGEILALASAKVAQQWLAREGNAREQSVVELRILTYPVRNRG